MLINQKKRVDTQQLRKKSRKLEARLQARARELHYKPQSLLPFDILRTVGPAKRGIERLEAGRSIISNGVDVLSILRGRESYILKWVPLRVEQGEFRSNFGD